MYTRAFGLGAAPKISRDEAKRAVQAIFLELLVRDPWDPYDAGAEGYVNCLVEGWCTTDFVRTEVIKSTEYRDKELARAQRVYAAAPSSTTSLAPAPATPTVAAFVPSPEASGDASGILSMSVGGIPIVYLAGALVLLMFLKRR